ncbi:hypothetical protein D3C87_1907320 [compost metagenome]
MLQSQPAARTDLGLQATLHTHGEAGRDKPPLPRMQNHRLRYCGMQVKAAGQLRHPPGQQHVLIARQFFQLHLKQRYPS